MNDPGHDYAIPLFDYEADAEHELAWMVWHRGTVARCRTQSQAERSAHQYNDRLDDETEDAIEEATRHLEMLT
jgi:hypothetical protein